MLVPLQAHQETCPVSCRHDHISILGATQLWSDDASSGGFLCHLDDVIYAVHLAASKASLEHAEAPIWAEFGVSSNKERECDFSVTFFHNVPQKIL